MPGDYSWRRFDKNKNYAPAGLMTQQGRVQLDSDWNEFMDALDRRFRAQTLDIMGQCVVPNDPTGNNIDGFKIGISADGKSLTIGPGRLYVDGILAENHGADPQQFDPVLAELRGTMAVDYLQQPFYPNPPVLPAMSGPNVSPFLVYVDVWQREVTYLEDPGLIERAVAVDTTARMQTVWQVKTCQGTQCKDFQNFLNNNPTSPGRLTTAGVAMGGQNDLCIIPPAGGYTGLENHLFRVEIHKGGAPGTAMFKWSRDNASFGTNVTSISGSTLTVAQLGRDSVIRFKYGDWIEIIDDNRELNGVPGQIVQIKNHPDESDLAIVVDQTIGGDGSGAFGATDALVAKYNTRIRKWDQNSIVLAPDGSQYADVNATQNHGLIPVPNDGTQIVLENGVGVTFSRDQGSGAYNPGDYWVFAARTFGAWVEPLTQAPPRGIHHHYGCLGVVSSSAVPVAPCPAHWPPAAGSDCCDCTYCVTPESHADDGGTLTIGMAVQQAITNGGGKICIAAGTYKLNAAIQINQGSSIRITGQGWNTVLAPVAGVNSAIWVEGSSDVIIENLAIVSPQSSNIDAVSGPTVQNYGPPGGMAVSNSMFITVRNCAFSLISTDQVTEDTFTENIWPTAIALVGILLEVRVRDNFIVGSTGIGKAASLPAQAAPVPNTPEETALVSSGLLVENNLFWCVQSGIDFEVQSFFSGATRLSGNTVFGCTNAGITVTGAVSSTALGDSGVAATVPKTDSDVEKFDQTTAQNPAAATLDVSRNVLSVWGDGIVVGTDEARIEGNDISQFGTSSTGIWQQATVDKSVGHGIVLQVEASNTTSTLNHCQVIGNRITGVALDGISVQTPPASAMFKDNIIDTVGGGGIVMPSQNTDPKTVTTATTPTGTITVDGNQFLNMAGAVGTGYIISLTGLQTAAIEGNILTWNISGTNSRVSIVCAGCNTVCASNNQITDASQTAAGKLGIGVAFPFERVTIAGNRIVLQPSSQNLVGSSSTGVLIEGDQSRAWALQQQKKRAGISRNLLLLERGGSAASAETFVTIEGNHLEASNFAVNVSAVTVCLLVNNRCLGSIDSAGAAVKIQSTAVIANGNFVRGPAGGAMELDTDSTTAVVSSNIATGIIQVGDPLAAMTSTANVVSTALGI
jgi:hypothetical protein